MVRPGYFEDLTKEEGLGLATKDRFFESEPDSTTIDDSFDDRYEGRKGS